MEKIAWRPENFKSVTHENLLDVMLASVPHGLTCQCVRQMYDEMVSGQFDYSEWHRAFAFLGHLKDLEVEHSPECAFWLPFPPSAPPEEQSHPNFQSVLDATRDGEQAEGEPVP